MKKLLITLAIFGLVTVPTQAQAIFIVDTGPGVGGEAGLYNNAAASTGAPFQWLAGQFTTTQAWTINSLEGFIGENFNGFGMGTIDAVLYGDNAGMVNQADELFRQSFMIPEVAQGAGRVHDWRGPTGLNFDLNMGTYWMAFEVINDGDAFTSMRLDAPNLSGDITNYAFFVPANGQYSNTTITDVGLRIDASEQSQGPGDPNAIPEPATMLLFGSGMLGAFLKRRKS